MMISIHDEPQLDNLLSDPWPSVVDLFGRTKGDIIFLGVTGKMGPTLARMAKRASELSQVDRRVFGVSRFSSGGQAILEACGVEPIMCDLLEEDQVARLPDAPNVVLMAGRKFGSSGNPAETWALNSYLPGLICRRYQGSRIVAFSTGNVYGLTSVARGGSRETDPCQPVGEYAMSCLGRERVVEYFCRVSETPAALLRLNYACELRYGVLVDLARRIWAGQEIDLSMGHFIRDCGYHAALVSPGEMKDATEVELLDHCRLLADVIPLIGFYLQPAVGGRVLPVSFWRRLAEVKNLVAIKIAPFNRYQTIDVIRALVEVGRLDTVLYTGNDDNIITDLITPYRFQNCRETVELRIQGGILGQWAVWTRRAAEQLEICHDVVAAGQGIPMELLRLNVELTDANSAIFDAANAFAGCISGINEVLRRQGLLVGNWCLDPCEILSPGQKEEIDRVYLAYPHLNDDAFVAENLDVWLSD